MHVTSIGRKTARRQKLSSSRLRRQFTLRLSRAWYTAALHSSMLQVAVNKRRPEQWSAAMPGQDQIQITRQLH